MIANDDTSTSGVPDALDFSTSDTFSCHEEIASHGYTVLYRAQRYGRWYVLKGLRPEHRGDPLYMALLEKEFNAVVGLDHPNIARLYSHEDDAVAGPCLVMEYVDGRTLDAFLREKPSVSLRRKVTRQLLEAMDYYHRHQLVHRDLKPSNILVTRNGDNVKLIDFGLADADDYAVLKEPAYTEGYAAPEQRTEGAAIDCRTDLYAFGILLRQFFPHRYRHIVRRCTQRNPSRRYASAAAVKRAMADRDRVPWLAGVALLCVAVFAGVLHPIRHTSPVPQQKEMSQPQSAFPEVEKNEPQPAAESTVTQVSQQTPAVSTANTRKPVVLDVEKAEMQRYADSLTVDLRQQIAGASDELIASVMVGKAEMQMSIKLMELLSGIKARNEAQWDSCWYELICIQANAIKIMNAEHISYNWAAPSEEKKHEVERLTAEMEHLSEKFQTLYHTVMQHRGDHFME